MNREPLTIELDGIIDALSKPLTSEDVLMGWNEALRNRWHQWFVQTKRKVAANLPLRQTEVNVAYGLGYDGIESGTLASRAARVGAMLMQTARDEGERS